MQSTFTYQNWTQEEIKRELNSGNACYPFADSHFVLLSAVPGHKDEIY